MLHQKFEDKLMEKINLSMMNAVTKQLDVEEQKNIIYSKQFDFFGM